MSIEVQVYDNGDHTAIVWLPKDGVIAGCLGFAIKRTHNGTGDYLHSFVGFTEGATLPADPQDWWKWPLQRYMWWDYHVKSGDTVKYQVIPVTGTPASPQLATNLASDWTGEMKVSGQCTANMEAYFNKGIVAAQWVSRELDQEAKGQNRKSAINDIIKHPGDPLRDALAGLLKVEILQLLNGAKGGQVYAALYELNDPELEGCLTAMKGNAHVILANGAFSKAKPDENADARAALKKAGVDLHDRMVTAGHFAHNKFAVICDASGRAQKVLTGSTNWSVTGLCTQANNGLIVNDAAVADCFLQQWNRLKAAGNGFPADLTSANSEIKQFTVDGVKVTPWFAPTTQGQDLDYARKLIANAKTGVLFLFFNPGTYQEDPEKETLLQDVLARKSDNLYLRGVVNQQIKNLVTLVGDSSQTGQPVPQAALVPANIKKAFHSWEDELLGASMVMVHSKVIVLDPFGDYPVLMTGSHNLGFKASHANDDNLVILEGPEAAPLAVAYAVNIIAIYQNYRWNSYVTQHGQDPNAWHGLQGDDQWQKGHLQGSGMDELKFWTAGPAAEPAAHTATASAGEGTPHTTAAHQPARTHAVKTTSTRHRNT